MMSSYLDLSRFGGNMASMSDRNVVILVFAIYFLDNVLLSIIVPILPNYMQDMEEKNRNSTNKRDLHLEGKIGFLFASKSIVQLFVNPIIGYLAERIGYKGLIYAGNFTFLLSSIIYASSTSYTAFLFARSIHGIGSATGIISGLSLLASTFEDDEERSKYMGIAMGGMAVGVLVGYPLGGIFYNLFGKTTPFLVVTVLCLICTIIQFMVLRNRTILKGLVSDESVFTVLKDPYIIVCIASICLSTSSIATLEPCLPIWLRNTMHPPEWQMGTAFLPDSFGYLLGTNFFGSISIKIGRWICALSSHIMIALSLFLIPMAKNVTHLIVPHFGVGLGIAVIDASLMPLLAWLVERRHNASYCLIYSLTQMAVCLAYGLGPLLGGWLMELLSFEMLIWSIAFLNLIVSFTTILLRKLPSPESEPRRINPDVSTVSFYQDYGSEKYKFLYESD